MNRKLLDLSGKIDQLAIELFEDINNVAKSMNVEFFVIGATARDMILTYGYNIKTTRATLDIDFGIQVANWDQDEKFRKGLLATKCFELVPNYPQRLLYKNILKIDVIPFGAIADPEHRFNWPKEDGIEMNTLGFMESYEYALTVRLRENPVLDMRFASLAGLALMKIIAWNDNTARGGRDAKDLKLIIHNYLDAGNEERLFEGDIIDRLKETGLDFDYIKAGARLLGRDMAIISGNETKKKILEILEMETGDQDRYKLVESMRDIGNSENFEEYIELLEQMKLGVIETK